MKVIDDTDERKEKELTPREIYKYLLKPEMYGKFMYVGSGTEVRVTDDGTIRRRIRRRNTEVDEPITFGELEDMCEDFDSSSPGIILKEERE